MLGVCGCGVVWTLLFGFSFGVSSIFCFSVSLVWGVVFSELVSSFSVSLLSVLSFFSFSFKLVLSCLDVSTFELLSLLKKWKATKLETITVIASYLLPRHIFPPLASTITSIRSFVKSAELSHNIPPYEPLKIIDIFI